MSGKAWQLRWGADHIVPTPRTHSSHSHVVYWYKVLISKNKHTNKQTHPGQPEERHSGAPAPPAQGGWQKDTQASALTRLAWGSRKKDTHLGHHYDVRICGGDGKMKCAVERWESERNRGVCTLWRKVGQEPGTGRHEEPVQQPEAMVISRPGLLPRAVSVYTALPQLRSVMISVALSPPKAI